jgi:hypothetical protein
MKSNIANSTDSPTGDFGFGTDSHLLKPMKPTPRLVSVFRSGKSGLAIAVLATFPLTSSSQAQTTGFNQTGAGPFE